MSNITSILNSATADILAIYLTDESYLRMNYHFLSSRFIQGSDYQWIAEQILQHFLKYKEMPTEKHIQFQIDSLSTTDPKRKQKLRESLLEITQKTKGSLQWIKDQHINIISSHQFSQTMLKTADLLGKKVLSPTELQSQLNRMSKSLTDIPSVSNTHLLSKTDASVLFDPAKVKQKFPTPWPVLNSVIDGGVEAGQVFVIVSPPHKGKTWKLSNIAINLVEKGYNVLYVSTEMSESRILQRFCSCLTETFLNNLTTEHAESQLSALLTKLKGDFRIKRLDTNERTIESLEVLINRLELGGFKPDILVYDSADDMEWNGNLQSWEKAGKIYPALQDIGNEYGMPVFTASQTNRAGWNDVYIDSSVIADSRKKLDKADILLMDSNLTSKEQRWMKYGAILIEKNRNGETGFYLHYKMNTANGQVEIAEQGSREAREFRKKATSNRNSFEQHEKDTIRNMLEQFSNNSTDEENGLRDMLI